MAHLLGYTPSGLSYILYNIPDDQKYKTYKINKKSGGVRIINAPVSHLKKVQVRLAKLLYECIKEIQDNNRYYLSVSHGFQKNRTIVSNAHFHRRRRYVFNIDLEDFFSTINFGRVYGFFLKDKYFSVDKKIATLLAQIACHESAAIGDNKSALPQGSPSSPVISNLIGNILDRELVTLAHNAKCTYTRYADDLTFSTNMSTFPADIAINPEGSKWLVGKKLSRKIERAGFSINEAKTRMALKCSRQVVTGLVVNAKPNIKQEYYQTVRVMCHSLFNTGKYFVPASLNAGKSEMSGILDESKIIDENEVNDEEPPEYTEDLNRLEGMLSYINFIKMRRDRRDHKFTEHSEINKRAKKAHEFEPPTAPGELYKKFLFYKYFVVPKAPLIVCEGKTDIIYLKCAIRALASNFPELAESDDDEYRIKVNFLKRSGSIIETLGAASGTSGQEYLFSIYRRMLNKFNHKPVNFPVIICCDNDEGAKNLFKLISKDSNTTISASTKSNYYYLFENLYIVKIPEKSTNTKIEDLFPSLLRGTKVDGRVFELEPHPTNAPTYSKQYFAEKIVRKNRNATVYADFHTLLARISSCITNYRTIR